MPVIPDRTQWNEESFATKPKTRNPEPGTRNPKPEPETAKKNRSKTKLI